MNINKKLNTQATKETGASVEIFKSKNDNQLYYKNSNNELVNVMTDRIKSYDLYSELPVEGVINTFYIVGQDIYMWNGTSYFSITTVPVTPSEIVNFDQDTPTTGGVVFTPDMPNTEDVLYVSSTNASLWIYNGSTYETYTQTIPENTPFYLTGTTIDAGGNKTAFIQRNGPILINSTSTSYNPLYVYNRDSSGVANGPVFRRDSRVTSGYGLLVQNYKFSSTGPATVTQLRVNHDGSLLINDAYTLPNVDGTAGQVPTTDGAGNVTWQDGVASGVFGIANSSGVYTYYATLTLAMASAVSGDTVEMFADVNETGSVTITLKDGVKINGNGHTYKLSVDDTTTAFFNNTTNAYCEIYNMKIVRTGRALGSTGLALQFGSSLTTGTLKCFGVSIINDFGDAVRGIGTLYGLNVKAYGSAYYESSPSYFPKIYDSYFESYGNGAGAYNPTANFYNVRGLSISSNGIRGGNLYNCTGISTSGRAIQSNTATNCTGISSTAEALYVSAGYNCTGISTSSYGGYGIFYNSALISSSGTATYQSQYNCYIYSGSNVPCLISYTDELVNCTIICNWDNASGHCMKSNIVMNGKVINCDLKVRNASAYCITTYPGSTIKYANNSFNGSTTPVNTSNVTQGITNTSDSQGNILI